MKSRRWTKDELILAFALYLKTPFGKMHHNNPNIISLSKLIDRTPSSVAMRLTNFASLDPFLQNKGIKGLTGGLNICKPIWDEFFNNREELFYRSEELLANLEKINIEEKFLPNKKEIDNYIGQTRDYVVKTRVNQNVFRQIILSNYSEQCAISGINIPEILIASHIVPWSKNSKERLNPSNGICLSPLYDASFDKGLIGIKIDYEIIFSKRLKTESHQKFYDIFFKPYENQKIRLPERFLPQKEFLEYHLDTIFEK